MEWKPGKHVLKLTEWYISVMQT